MTDGAATPPTRRGRRLSAEARRETILTAALEVFAEHGPEGGRLRQIAEKAGITEPYLFRHFPSKAELYEAAVVRPLLDLVAALETRLAEIPSNGPTTGAELVLRINRVMLDFMLEAVPYIGAAMFGDIRSGSDTYQEVASSRVHRSVADLLAHIKGWPSPTVPVELVAKSIWGINYGIALDAILSGIEVDIDRDKTAERITRLYTLGIPAFQAGSA